MFLTHLRIREVPYSQDDVKVGMEPISGIEEMQRIEVLTAATQLSQMMFMAGTAMGIPPDVWVPYILKDVMKISDADLARMPIDPAQIQQVGMMAAAQASAPADQQQTQQERKRELMMGLNEELNKEEYTDLRNFLVNHSDAPEELLEKDYTINQSELPPLDLRKQGRGRKGRIQ